jgi:hypothetical protein
MALVVPNTGDVLMLKYIVNQLKQDGTVGDPSGQRVLKLYNNNYSPVKATAITDLTEVTATGYSEITLSGTNWTVATSTAGTNSAVYSEQTFNFTTAVTVYGYYVATSELTPKLLWVERFSTAPFTLPAGGGEIAITPRITLN